MPRLSEKKKEMIEEMMKEALYRASASVISDQWLAWSYHGEGR